MLDKFIKFAIAVILLCVIAFWINTTNKPVILPKQDINISSNEQIIQLAPNRIAIIDTNSNSGMSGTILVFEYNDTTKKFEYVSSMNYKDYFANPSKYGIPTN